MFASSFSGESGTDWDGELQNTAFSFVKYKTQHSHLSGVVSPDHSEAHIGHWEKKTCTVWKWKAVGGGGWVWVLVCEVWWGNSATHASLLYSRCCDKNKARGLFSITILCCTYVFATESSSSCSWRKRWCRMCLRAAPREKRNNTPVNKTCRRESGWKTKKLDVMQEAVKSTTRSGGESNVKQGDCKQFSSANTTQLETCSDLVNNPHVLFYKDMSD